MPKAICLSISLIIGAIAPVQLYGQTLQRLFTTPSIRAELDRLRFQIASGSVIEEPVVDERLFEISIPIHQEVDVIYAFGGTMRKADGNYTVWINNVAYDQTRLPANIELLSPYSQGQVLIHDVGSGSSFKVKPGQVLNLSAGQLYESYQYQAVLAANAAEVARVAVEDVADPDQDTGAAKFDSADGEAVNEAAQDLGM